MNNPATLALMPEGRRVDLAFGFLGPQVKSQGVASDADSFSMPAFGWVPKSGKWTAGVGIYGQGGMGTEYAGSTASSAPWRPSAAPAAWAPTGATGRKWAWGG
jgi:Outer membrane protein transport protein (OMPP1/FadL/TodX).